MIAIGIGGNIGSGKTTVAEELVRYFQKNNYLVKLLDADSIAWKLYKRTAVSGKQFTIYDKIVKTFGSSILNKNQDINRRKLGELVFNDRKNLNKLNAIVHPALIRQINTELKNKDAEVKILDAALLFFWGKNINVKYRVLVISPDKLKIARMKNRGYNASEVKSRLKQQMKESQMEKFADFVINNDRTLKALKNKVKLLYEILKD
jgi:dephospho-CoA kinase